MTRRCKKYQIGRVPEANRFSFASEFNLARLSHLSDVLRARCGCRSLFGCRSSKAFPAAHALLYIGRHNFIKEFEGSMQPQLGRRRFYFWTGRIVECGAGRLGVGIQMRATNEGRGPGALLDTAIRYCGHVFG